ncbi:MAG: transglycosylase domain-containing protein [Ruminococcus sp.]|nr:transglycosylase domain-containing protein [Ruminococcus sp.]
MDNNNINAPQPQELRPLRPVRSEMQPPPQPQRLKKKKKKKKKTIPLLILKKLVTVIATTLLSLFLVMVITGTIVATALTVYVLDFMEDATTITLSELESGSDTYFYGYETQEDGTKELTVLKRLKTDTQRLPVDIEKVPQNVRNCFVYTEDERFYLHDGVDYKRTFSAFLNMFIHFYATDQGGSTITQQLVKNLTGDDEHTPQRKIREIFSAMQLEKTYSKDEILEAYLNYIGFGGPINGIQLASTRYFGKNVWELTTPEAAVLAAIPQSPQWYGPFVETYNDEGKLVVDGKANNKVRQRYVLWQLYHNGVITYDEYQEYLNTKILYTDEEEYRRLHPEIDLEEMENAQSVYTWEVDAMMYEAAHYLMDEYNIDKWEAIKRINKGGYRIYSTLDDQMQAFVEERCSSLDNILSSGYVRKYVDLDNDGQAEEQLPHVGFIALDYDGSVKCLLGNWGEKTDSLVTNYAVEEPRQIGSTMKPISTYGLALERDEIHWGSVFQDKEIMEVDGKKWPTNYSVDSKTSISYAYHNIYYFLQQSFNTVPAQLCQMLTPHEVYLFCTEKMGMKLDAQDEDYSPLSVGSLTYGITLENLVNAYIPYGNGGTYCDAHIISRIEDGNRNVIYSNDGNPREAVSESTAWVMNRLLKNVIDRGTGTFAKLNYKTLCGKTGTTDNWYDLTFVGLTRDFVSGVTIGYKEYNPNLTLPTGLHSASVWKSIIGDYADTMFTDTPVDFDEPKEGVVGASMCAATGMIAGPYCGHGQVQGWWKSSNAPVCTGNHAGAHYAGEGSGTNNNNNNNTWNNNNNSWNDTGNTWNDTGNSWTDNSGGWNDNSGGWTDNSGGGDSGWTDNSGGGWNDTSGGGDGGWTDNSGGGDAGWAPVEENQW